MFDLPPHGAADHEPRALPEMPLCTCEKDCCRDDDGGSGNRSGPDEPATESGRAAVAFHGEQTVARFIVVAVVFLLTFLLLLLAEPRK